MPSMSCSGSGAAVISQAVEVKVVELDFGATPIMYGQWTVTDPDIHSGSHIIAQLSGMKPTGRDRDEVEMEPMWAWAGPMSNGSFILTASPFDGPVYGNYKFHYSND